MTRVLRLLILMLTVTLVTGLGAREVVAARMAIAMAGPAAEQASDDLCVNCSGQAADRIACDADCTASFADLGAAPDPLQVIRPSTLRAKIRATRQVGISPDPAPSPPRTTALI